MVTAYLKQMKSTLYGFSKNIITNTEKLLHHESPQARFWEENKDAVSLINVISSKGSTELKSILNEYNISLNSSISGDSIAFHVSTKLSVKNVMRWAHDTNFKQFTLDLAAGQASIGNVNACEILRKKFNLAIEPLAIAAARGGNFSYTDYLTKEYAIPKPLLYCAAATAGEFDYCFKKNISREDVLAIAKGAAIGGHYQYAEKLREDCAIESNHLAQAAALGGWVEYAEWLCKAAAADISVVIQYAAQGGHIKQAIRLQELYNVPTEVVVKGAAVGGHHRYCTYQTLLRPELMPTVARLSAEYGFLNYCEHLRTVHDAKVEHLSYGATLGGHKNYVEFLVKHQSASWTNIALAAVQKDDIEEVMHCLNSGADATSVVLEAFSLQRSDTIARVVLKREFTIDALVVAKAALEYQHFSLALQLQTQCKLCPNELAEFALSRKAQEFAEMLREAKKVTTKYVAIKALECDNYEYLDYLKELSLLPVLAMAETAVLTGKTTFAEAGYNARKSVSLHDAKVYLDHMLIGAVRAKNEQYVLDLLARGASQAVALYYASKTNWDDFAKTLHQTNASSSFANRWVGIAAGGLKNTRRIMLSSLEALELKA